MDTTLHPFAGLRAGGIADANGDIAFDEDACATTSRASTVSIVQFDDL
jgi:tRNA 2-thiocytidine biosynthesis protein TtcA